MRRCSGNRSIKLFEKLSGVSKTALSLWWINSWWVAATNSKVRQHLSCSQYKKGLRMWQFTISSSSKCWHRQDLWISLWPRRRVAASLRTQTSRSCKGATKMSVSGWTSNSTGKAMTKNSSRTNSSSSSCLSTTITLLTQQFSSRRNPRKNRYYPSKKRQMQRTKEPMKYS